MVHDDLDQCKRTEKDFGERITDPIDHLLQFFDHDHLPEHLKIPASMCTDLAYYMAEELPRNPETTVGLRKLLEAKDAFVRSALLGSKEKEKG